MQPGSILDKLGKYVRVCGVDFEPQVDAPGNELIATFVSPQLLFSFSVPVTSHSVRGAMGIHAKGLQ